MTISFSLDPIIQNQEEYDNLLVSIEAGQGVLNLLIAVCDDIPCRNAIINRYEQDLAPQIQAFRVILARGEPSLRAAIAELVQTKVYLQEGGAAVITVTGAEDLHFLKFGAERSEQQIFFGYLQWTREALQKFNFSLVIWVTKQLEIELSKKAPDFWSWRKGVFRFATRKSGAVLAEEIPPLEPNVIEFDSEEDFLLPLPDLLKLIHSVEQDKGPNAKTLMTLYQAIAQIYKHRVETGQSQDYRQEQTIAIDYFEKSLNLQNRWGRKSNLDLTTSQLAALYESQGEYLKAEPLYQQALEFRRQTYGQSDLTVADSLIDLAGLYHAISRYSEAEKLYQEALDIQEKFLPQNAALVATTYNYLAGTYHAQGKYLEAEDRYKTALQLWEKSIDDNQANLANFKNNLGLLYYEQGRYADAEPLFQEALQIKRQLLGSDHPDIATSLNNLALLYYAQENYPQAEDYLQQALNLRKTLLGPNHPDVAGSLNNLATVYKQQRRYSEAIAKYQEALAILEETLGQDHVIAARIRENLAKLKIKNCPS